MVMGTLTIFASGNKADIEHMDKKDGKQIADTVRGRLAGFAPRPMSAQQPPMPPQPMAPPHTMAPPVPTPEPDVYEQLRKLGELRDLGIVTPEEFEQKKRELLARI